MPTTTEILPMHLTMGERTDISSGREMIGSVMRRARKTDWDDVVVQADRFISIAGVAAVIVSLLYFVPVFMTILVR